MPVDSWSSGNTRIYHPGGGLESPSWFTAVSNPAYDLHAELIQGQNFIRQTSVGHEPGHSPNYARFLILSQNLAAGLVNMFAASQAILTHPGHHDGQGVRFVDVGHRPKKHVYSRAAGVFRRTL